MSPELTKRPDPAERRQQAALIGRRIRALRMERGMTQRDVAGDRFSKAYISALETGSAAPSMHSLQHIATQLGVAPEWFLSAEPLGEEVALPARIKGAWLSRGRIFVELYDGRALGLPVSRSRELRTAPLDRLEAWEVVDRGRAIAWPAIGEQITLEDFLGLRILPRHQRRRAMTLADARAARVDAVEREAASVAKRVAGPRASASVPRRRGRYAPLAAWLRKQAGAEVHATLRDVERINGRRLPPSARRYTGPWYTARNPLAQAIASAGWRATTDLANERVTFRRR